MMKCNVVFCRTYFIVFIYFLLEAVHACTPPNSKSGDYTVKRMSIVQRAVRAKIVLIGTVVNFHKDRFGNQDKREIAVHMTLKGDDNMKKYINVTGFGSSHRDPDCTDTFVDLYGTYILLVKKDRYGGYHVDQIEHKSASSELTCDHRHMVKRSRRILKKFRKLRNNKAQCYDVMSGKRIKSRKCLRLKHLSKYLNEFKYNGIRTRHTYCTLKHLLGQKNNYNKKTGEELMRDDVINNWKRRRHDEATTSSSWKHKNWLEKKKRDNRNDISSNTNIIVFSNKNSYIFHQSQETKLPSNWRLIESYTHKRTSSAMMIYLSSVLLFLCLLVHINL